MAIGALARQVLHRNSTQMALLTQPDSLVHFPISESVISLLMRSGLL